MDTDTLLNDKPSQEKVPFPASLSLSVQMAGLKLERIVYHIAFFRMPRQKRAEFAFILQARRLGLENGRLTITK